MAPPRGIERDDEKPRKQGFFCKWANFKGTGGGLKTPKPEDLTQICEVWDQLPEATTEAIVKLVIDALREISRHST